MKFIIDNQFRNPLRWGKCSQKHIDHLRVFGFKIEKQYVAGRIKPLRKIIFYFWKWYRLFIF